MPKVSVIIPAHNARTFIDRAIKSVLEQHYGDIEIIIVDDGSTDDLKEHLKEYLSDTKIKYIPTERGGVSHAINAGLGYASGEYIAILHADDTYLQDKIEKQLKAMQAHPRCVISYTNERYFLEGTSRIIDSPYFHFSGDVFYFLKRSNFIHMSTAMFRADVLKALRLDEKLSCHEDWDAFLKLAARGEKFIYVPGVLSSISVNPKSLTFNTDLMDTTRREVGLRAKALWGAFKKGINIYSMNGIMNLKRYIVLKLRALLADFPGGKIYNRPSPKEIFLSNQDTAHAGR